MPGLAPPGHKGRRALTLNTRSPTSSKNGPYSRAAVWVKAVLIALAFGAGLSLWLGYAGGAYLALSNESSKRGVVPKDKVIGARASSVTWGSHPRDASPDDRQMRSSLAAANLRRNLRGRSSLATVKKILACEVGGSSSVGVDACAEFTQILESEDDPTWSTPLEAEIVHHISLGNAPVSSGVSEVRCTGRGCIVLWSFDLGLVAGDRGSSYAAAIDDFIRSLREKLQLSHPGLEPLDTQLLSHVGSEYIFVTLGRGMPMWAP